ncbi:hypothetical protein MKX03_004596 [Papaver bracteatum]|nr:hypothetical protein MKX03_004596 [Papaver bracteatum]
MSVKQKDRRSYLYKFFSDFKCRCVWRIRIELIDAYPYESLLIGFVNKIYHPNSRLLLYSMSGSACLDVSNQTWSLIFDLVNVYEVFLMQCLSVSQPISPLNREAAALMMRDKAAYEQTVKGFMFGITGRSSEEDEARDNDHPSSDEGMTGHADP